MMKKRMKGERGGWMERRRIRKEWWEGLLEKELLEGGQMQNDRRLWK